MHTDLRQTAFCRLLAVGLLLFSPAAFAQSERLDRDLFMGGRDVLRSFESVISDAYQSVVEVRCDRRLTGLGTVVDGRGYLVTKASELTDGQITVRLHDGRELVAERLTEDRSTDLALLWVDDDSIPAVTWPELDQVTEGDEDKPEAEPVPVGTWVITVGQNTWPEAVGVVSASERQIRGGRLLLGVQPESVEQGVLVRRVVPNRGAERAGMQQGDIIIRVGETAVTTVQHIAEALSTHWAGEAVEVLVLRQGKEMTLSVELSQAGDGERNHPLHGELSDRRDHFARVIQHDTAIHPKDCGGPVLNIAGELLGINIARAERVATFALPVDVAWPAIQTMIEASQAD